MFHRVKSETQQEQNEQEQDMVPAEEQAQEIEAQAPEAQQEETQLDIEAVEPLAKTEETDESETEAETEAAQDYQASQSASRPGYTASPYAAVGQTAYGASAATSTSVAAPSSSSVSDSADYSENDRRLTIGRGITMSGEIESCDYLLVEGTVEAALRGANALDIAESGVFYGTVEIENATIAGRFEGDIQVNGRLSIRSTGVVTGTIAYKELAVEAGAVIDGRLTPVAAKVAAAAQPAAAPTAAKKKPKAATSRPSAAPSRAVKKPAPANSDGELFAESVTAAE